MRSRALLQTFCLLLSLSPTSALAQSLGGRLGTPGGGANTTPTPPAPDGVDDSVFSFPPSPAPAPSPLPSTAYHATPGSGAVPDLVLTHDGGMIRGTIVRSQPGQSVVVQLPTGEVDEIPWGAVRYAGPAAQAPTLQPGAPTTAVSSGIRVSNQQDVHIRFTSDQRLTLHNEGATATATASAPGSWVTVHSQASRWDRVCTAPCDFSIAPGQYRFAASLNGSAPLAGPVVEIAASGTLFGHYVDHSGLRAGGWVVWALSLFGGLAAGTGVFLANTRDMVPGLIVAGVGILISLLVGLPMINAGDGVAFRFE